MFKNEFKDNSHFGSGRSSWWVWPYKSPNGEVQYWTCPTLSVNATIIIIITMQKGKLVCSAKKKFLFSYRELSHQPVVGCNYLQPIRLQQFQKWLSLIGCLKLRVTTKLTTVGKAEIISLIWLSVTSENDVGVQTGRPSLVHSGAIVPLRASLNLSEMSEEEVDRRLTQVWILKIISMCGKGLEVSI